MDKDLGKTPKGMGSPFTQQWEEVELSGKDRRQIQFAEWRSKATLTFILGDTERQSLSSSAE